MPWHVEQRESCPSSKPWAVVKDDSGAVVACHESKEDAEGQMAAMYANDPEARAAGQWDALYGDLAGRWMVLRAAIGTVPPSELGPLAYLGEPGELLNRLHTYRLSLASTGTIAKHTRRVLATELDLPVPTLAAYVHSGGPVVLSTRGWGNLVRAVIYMETGRSATNGMMARL